MNKTKLDVSLEQYEVGLSGAVPDRNDWSEPAMDRGILEFVALFSGLVFKYGGRIVHGSHPTFTPVILRQARQHAGDRPRKPVTLVMSDLWACDLPDDYVTGVSDVAEFVITRKIGDGGPEDSKTRNQSLSAMPISCCTNMPRKVIKPSLFSEISRRGAASFKKASLKYFTSTTSWAQLS